jgi:UDP-glucuronate decarboxylase
VNLGNPDERSVGEIAHTILELTGSTSPLEYRPLPTDDPTRRCPDITVARAEIGWEPTVATEDGLRTTIEHFRQELHL